MHQTEIDAIRKKAKQLADAGVASYDDALERLSSQALRDVDGQYASSHPGADVQAQAWLDQVQAQNPAGFDHMPLFQATRTDYNDPTKYAGTKLTNPDIYTAANRPAIPGTLSPTSPSLSAIATGNLKALGNLGIDLYNRGLDIAVGDAGKSAQLSPFTLTPDESAAAQATGYMAAPFGAEDIGGLLSPKKGGSVGGESVEAGSQGAGANNTAGQNLASVGPGQNPSGDLNTSGNAARTQPYGNGVSASPSPGADTAGNSGAGVQAPSAANTPATSGGTANASTLQGLKDQLANENLANIAARDPRLAAAVNGSGASNPNFSIGSGTGAEANALGQTWVGDGATLVSNQGACPGCLVSADGTRIYRPPQPKSSPFATTGVQANFVRQSPSGTIISNGHLNITP